MQEQKFSQSQPTRGLSLRTLLLSGSGNPPYGLPKYPKDDGNESGMKLGKREMSNIKLWWTKHTKYGGVGQAIFFSF